MAASALTRALATIIRESLIDSELKLELARNLGSTLFALDEIEVPDLAGTVGADQGRHHAGRRRD